MNVLFHSPNEKFADHDLLLRLQKKWSLQLQFWRY